MPEPQAADHAPQGERLPWYAQLLDRLAARKKTVLVVAAVLFGVASMVALAVDWTVPKPVKMFAFWTFVFAPYGRWLGKKAKSWLWNPGMVVGVELAAEDDEKGGVYAWPSTAFRRNEVTKGSLDWVHPTLFFARQIELDDEPGDRGGELVGCWRGTLSDRELMWSLQKVAECRGQLIEDAARGFVLENAMWITTFNAARCAVDELREMMEDGTLPDRGDGIDEAIARAISDAGLGDLVDDGAGDLDVPDEWAADDGAFSDPLGAHDYSEEAKEEAETGSVSTGDPFKQDVPDRELSTGDD